jgi:ABC-type multidrug transport system ATPase subunit
MTSVTGGTEVIFENVVKRDRFGRPQLDGISLALEPHDHVALVGKLGSGKTALLALAAGLYEADEGQVLIDGVNIVSFDYHELQEHRRRTGYVFELKGLLANTTIFENIALPLRYFNGHELDDGEIRGRVQAMLQELDIEKFAGDIPARVNASAQKRALLGRGLILEPSLLIIDEPQAGLVPEEQELVARSIESRRAKRGMTILQSDHDGAFGPLMPDRVVVIDEGRMTGMGGPELTMGPDFKRPGET